jgi:DNA-binding LacI/PurR family transcriptional regulator
VRGSIDVKVTIKEVARHAGVSIATVSKVINNRDYVSEKTREKVKRAIAELQYEVNANAQSLKAVRSRKVAVLVSDISNTYLMSIAKAVEEMIRSIGYHMILMSHNDAPDIEYELLQIVQQQQVDAMVLIPTGENSSTIKRMVTLGVHVIAVDRKVNDLQTDYIADDNFYGSYESVRYLQSLRHQRIAVLYGHRRNSIGEERYQGALAALKEGNTYDPTLFRGANFKEEEAYRLTTELLSLPEPPTAIYSANNTMTLGVLQAIKERGLEMPNDISVIAFGDETQWKLFRPKLTLMVQQAQQIGLEAAIMLKNRLTIEKPYPVQERIIKPVLQQNETCNVLRGH